MSFLGLPFHLSFSEVFQAAAQKMDMAERGTSNLSVEEVLQVEETWWTKIHNGGHTTIPEEPNSSR